MGKVLALATFILGLIAVACGGAASPTTGVTSGAQQALETAPVAGAFNADIKDFAHQDITVAAGTTVAWTNRDGVAHTTTEVSDTEIWDSFALQSGQSFSFTFTEAGTFNYFCTIHRTMRATVTVTGQQTPTVTPTREAVPTPKTDSKATVTPPVAGAGPILKILDFSHQDLKVEAGTTVTWTNAGAVIHTITSSDGLWDSGVLDSGQSFKFTFTQAGSFPFFCNIHPSMIAIITVTGTPEAQPAPTATSTPPPTTERRPAPTSPAGDGLIVPTVNADMQNFQHEDLTVPEGTTVVWTNLDVVQHTVTSGSPSDPDAGSLFDSGSDFANWVVEGETYSFTFNQAGVFPYYCRVHGVEMNGTITVTPAQPAPIATTPMVVSTKADIRDFSHQDLTLKAGTTVVWTNRGNSTHTTTADNGAWDSPDLTKGKSFSFTFAEAGVFRYFCAIHPSMTAKITVTN